MDTATVLSNELKRLNLTHEEVARLTNYSRQSVTAWCMGRPIPPEARRELAKLSPRLALELAAMAPSNLFISGWLDGDVDLSILGVVAKLAEELEEAADLLRMVRLVNKRRPEQLCDTDKQHLEALEQELLDLMTGIPVVLIKLSESYDRDLHAAIRKHRTKLIQRKYKRKISCWKVA